MAKFSLFFLVLLTIISIFYTTAARPSYYMTRGKTYVESQCRRTLYPKLCTSCLTGFVNSSSQSPHDLAQAALEVSLVRARYTSSYMAKVIKNLRLTKSKDYQAVQECIHQMNDGAFQLSSALKELRRLSLDGENDFVWHQSNILTWISTMETNAFTCMDGISGSGNARLSGRVRRVIQAKVVNTAQATSIALTMFNHFAAAQRAAFSKNKP